MINANTRVPEKVITACKEVQELVEGLSPQTRTMITAVFDSGEPVLPRISAIIKKMEAERSDSREIATIVTLGTKIAIQNLQLD